MEIVIKGRPITKKNHSQIVRSGGRSFIIPSAQYRQYEEQCLWQIRRPEQPINYPVNVCCIYYMPTHNRVDLVNLQEATLDILVKARVLADDNSKIVVSMDGSCVNYDKDNPRTEITIEQTKT